MDPLLKTAAAALALVLTGCNVNMSSYEDHEGYAKAARTAFPDAFAEGSEVKATFGGKLGTVHWYQMRSRLVPQIEIEKVGDVDVKGVLGSDLEIVTPTYADPTQTKALETQAADIANKVSKAFCLADKVKFEEVRTAAHASKPPPWICKDGAFHANTAQVNRVTVKFQ